MKHSFFISLLIIFTTSAHAQFFSGELQYDKRIVPKVQGLNVDSIMALEPGVSTYWIAEGYYKTMYRKDDKDFYSYTYHGDTKRMFDENAEKDYITFRDSRKPNSTRIRSIIYKDSTKNIAGHTCFMVERIYENYISKTYYAQDLKINADSFKDHATGDWYFQIKEVDGALSLGSVLEYATHYDISEVIKITPRTFKPADFALPPGKIVVASSNALDKEVELEQPTTEAINCYRQKLGSSLEAMPSANYVAYVGFIVTSDGGIKHVEPYEEDEYGFYKVAVDIISSCGLKFFPGTLEGKPVDSWVYFPIEFKK